MVKKGDIVTIRKGADVRSLHPQKSAYKLVRNQKVFVNLFLKEWDHDGIHHPPEVSWAGSGGYWCYAKLSDVVEPEDGQE